MRLVKDSNELFVNDDDEVDGFDDLAFYKIKEQMIED